MWSSYIMGGCNVEIWIIEGELSDNVYAKCYDFIKDLLGRNWEAQSVLKKVESNMIAIYARVSTEEQAKYGYSLVEQVRQCRLK